MTVDSVFDLRITAKLLAAGTAFDARSQLQYSLVSQNSVGGLPRSLRVEGYSQVPLNSVPTLIWNLGVGGGSSRNNTVRGECQPAGGVGLGVLLHQPACGLEQVAQDQELGRLQVDMRPPQRAHRIA